MTLREALKGVTYALWHVGDARLQVNSKNQLKLVALYDPNPELAVVVSEDMIINQETGELVCEEVLRET